MQVRPTRSRGTLGGRGSPPAHLVRTEGWQPPLGLVAMPVSPGGEGPEAQGGSTGAAREGRASARTGGGHWGVVSWHSPALGEVTEHRAERGGAGGGGGGGAGGGVPGPPPARGGGEKGGGGGGGGGGGSPLKVQPLRLKAGHSTSVTSARGELPWGRQEAQGS